MHIFDCNCSFGTPPRPPFRYAATATELIDEMDYCGIDEALVYHTNMRFSFAPRWNQGLVEETADISRLQPTWTILPSQTGEFPEPDVLLNLMRESGVRTLRAFPQEHHYQLDSRTFGDLFEMMSEHRIPLFAKDNILSLQHLLPDFPNLRVVAVNQGPHSIERYVRPLLDRFPCLMLDTSYYIIERTIEEFTDRYGSERLLFGTAFPDNCTGGAVLQLLHAEISPEKKAAIAGGNLKSILEEVGI